MIECYCCDFTFTIADGGPSLYISTIWVYWRLHAITDLEDPETIQQVLNGNYLVRFAECLLSKLTRCKYLFARQETKRDLLKFARVNTVDGSIAILLQNPPHNTTYLAR